MLLAQQSHGSKQFLHDIAMGNQVYRSASLGKKRLMMIDPQTMKDRRNDIIGDYIRAVIRCSTACIRATD
jgi:hypothetical protein